MKKAINFKILGLTPAILLTASLFVSVPLQADYQAFSQSPPANLSANKVPMFVSIGFDDNGIAGVGSDGGMNWILNFLKGRTNFDGSPARVTFFNTTKYMDKPNVTETWKRAYREGHEIGNHTVAHEKGGKVRYTNDIAENFSKDQWKQKIGAAQNSLKNMISGLGGNNPNPQVVGFRAPYLSYNDGMFSALKELGMVYDTSMQEGWASSMNTSNYPWPHTLPSGIWELNVAPLVMNHNNSTKVTGFDYNMWHKVYGKNLNATQSYDLLVENFDARLAGNRAPFMLGAHTDYYDSTYQHAGDFSQIKNAWERRQVIEKFIDYVRVKPEVRIVPFNDIVKWMRNPVALNNSSSGGSTGESAALDAIASKVSKFQEKILREDSSKFQQHSWAFNYLTKTLREGADLLWSGNKGDGLDKLYAARWAVRERMDRNHAAAISGHIGTLNNFIRSAGHTP